MSKKWFLKWLSSPLSFFFCLSYIWLCKTFGMLTTLQATGKGKLPVRSQRVSGNRWAIALTGTTRNHEKQESQHAPWSSDALCVFSWQQRVCKPWPGFLMTPYCCEGCCWVASPWWFLFPIRKLRPDPLLLELRSPFKISPQSTLFSSLSQSKPVPSPKTGWSVSFSILFPVIAGAGFFNALLFLQSLFTFIFNSISFIQ